MVANCAGGGTEGVKFCGKEEIKKTTPISPFLYSFFLMP